MWRWVWWFPCAVDCARCIGLSPSSSRGRVVVIAVGYSGLDPEVRFSRSELWPWSAQTSDMTHRFHRRSRLKLPRTPRGCHGCSTNPAWSLEPDDRETMRVEGSARRRALLVQNQATSVSPSATLTRENQRWAELQRGYQYRSWTYGATCPEPPIRANPEGDGGSGGFRNCCVRVGAFR